jgi:hypothetical protein
MHCGALVPHERSLAAKYQGRPFALLGVNSDTDRQLIRRVALGQNSGKRSWWDGGREGPIDSRWRVEGWPTVYVIDAHGVIRSHEFGLGPQTEAAVESLVVQAEKERATARR